MKKKQNSGYDGLGGNSFQEDMESGLGTQSQNEGFSNLGGNSFQNDMESGLGKQPEQKKKSGRKNILDEWTDAAVRGC